MGWKTLDEMDLAGKTVLTRVDINVPVDHGRVTDTTRIDRIVPTVEAILSAGGKPMLLAHFGRPNGKVVDAMSLRQLVPALESALGHTVQFIETLEGAEAMTEEARAAEVLLMENIRFYPGEEANDPDFAARIAGLGDIYCNDAFSAAHRAHASTEAIARLLPCCAGRLMQAELTALEAALGTPKRPVLAHGKVRHVGDAYAAVIAETAEQARDAVEAIEAEIEELPAVVDMHDALSGSNFVHDEIGTNQCFDWGWIEDNREATDNAIRSNMLTPENRNM